MKAEMKETEQNPITEQPAVDASSENLFEEFDLDDIEVIESKVFA